MKRREFIGLVGGAAAAWPFAAQAQQKAKVYRIARIHSTLPAAEAIKARNTKGSLTWKLYEELGRLGFVEGQNLVVEHFSLEGRTDDFSELVRDVVRSNPDLIYTDQTALVLAFKAATTTIPIVGWVGDPVANGIVPSLARPGGNITGVSINAGPEISGKYVELLKEAIPAVSKVAFLAPPTNWEDAEGVAMRDAAKWAQISLIGPPLDYPLEVAVYRRVIASMAQAGAEALIVARSVQNLANLRLIVELAEKDRLPAIFPYRQSCELGGLMAYAPDDDEGAFHIANQIAQILRGASPANIPYYQIAKFQMIINLKTAKALGLEIPTSLLLRANEVIE
jgi:putative ABC transport system substrate-binding protein